MRWVNHAHQKTVRVLSNLAVVNEIQLFCLKDDHFKRNAFDFWSFKLRQLRVQLSRYHPVDSPIRNSAYSASSLSKTCLTGQHGFQLGDSAFLCVVSPG